MSPGGDQSGPFYTRRQRRPRGGGADGREKEFVHGGKRGEKKQDQVNDNMRKNQTATTTLSMVHGRRRRQQSLLLRQQHVHLSRRWATRNQSRKCPNQRDTPQEQQALEQLGQFMDLDPSFARPRCKEEDQTRVHFSGSLFWRRTRCARGL